MEGLECCGPPGSVVPLLSPITWQLWAPWELYMSSVPTTVPAHHPIIPPFHYPTTLLPPTPPPALHLHDPSTHQPIPDSPKPDPILTMAPPALSLPWARSINWILNSHLEPISSSCLGMSLMETPVCDFHGLLSLPARRSDNQGVTPPSPHRSSSPRTSGMLRESQVSPPSPCHQGCSVNPAPKAFGMWDVTTLTPSAPHAPSSPSLGFVLTFLGAHTALKDPEGSRRFKGTILGVKHKFCFY